MLACNSKILWYIELFLVRPVFEAGTAAERRKKSPSSVDIQHHSSAWFLCALVEVATHWVLLSFWWCEWSKRNCGPKDSALEVPQKKYLVPVPVPLVKKELVPDTVHVWQEGTSSSSSSFFSSFLTPICNNKAKCMLCPNLQQFISTYWSAWEMW